MHLWRGATKRLLLPLLAAVSLHALSGSAQPVTKIAAGGEHIMFLKGDGSLWVMGHSEFGQLGDGTTTNTNRPEMVVNGGVIKIAAGSWHSLFITPDTIVNNFWRVRSVP